MTQVLVTEHHLSDIAEAIRYKSGSAATYRPGDMAAAIRDMTPQANLQEKTATQNGRVLPDEGYDGLSGVTVNVESGDALPEGYKRLAYVQGDGSSAYVNTGIVPTADTWVTETYLPAALTGTGTVEFGCRVAYQDHMLTVWRGQSEAKFQEINLDVGSLRTELKLSKAAPNNLYSIVYNRGGFSINDAAVTVAGAPDPSSWPIYLLALNNNGAAGFFSNSAVFDFAVGDSGGTLMRLVPCKRLSDSKIGFFDTVGGGFYANAGGGSFTAGPGMG